MRRILREYYARHAFQHVTEADFRAVASETSGRDLNWFFDQWLHTTQTLDFGIRSASTERLPDGRWRTRVEVSREGEAWMPVTLQVGETRALLDSRERVQVAEVITSQRPAAVLLDPDDILIDIDPANNRRAL
jgi:aminopeptidase N